MATDAVLSSAGRACLADAPRPVRAQYRAVFDVALRSRGGVMPSLEPGEDDDMDVISAVAGGGQIMGDLSVHVIDDQTVRLASDFVTFDDGFSEKYSTFLGLLTPYTYRASPIIFIRDKGPAVIAVSAYLLLRHFNKSNSPTQAGGAIVWNGTEGRQVLNGYVEQCRLCLAVGTCGIAQPGRRDLQALRNP